MRQNQRYFGAVSLFLSLCLMVISAAAEIPFSNGLLFKVQLGEQAPNYFFGTMHSDDPQVRKLAAQVEWALNKSRILAVEVEPDALSEISAVSMMVNPEGTGLHHMLGDELYRRALAEAERLGLPQITIEYYKPWALAVLFSLPPMKGSQVPDLLLAERARQQGKPVFGLETVEEQLAVFDRLPLADQKAMLIQALNNLDQVPMIYRELLKSYLARDLGELLRIGRDTFTTADQAQIERFQEALVYQRNRRMVERLSDRLTAGGVFVAVGALHLPGERGLLNMLRNRGFRVEAVY
ncbi:MAG: TraB/GumN family protein [Gammaproteobacteria bacterium]|nr:TraB/GumN family protein [Gammaproteobacteria bacterium]